MNLEGSHVEENSNTHCAGQDLGPEEISKDRGQHGKLARRKDADPRSRVPKGLDGPLPVSNDPAAPLPYE